VSDSLKLLKSLHGLDAVTLVNTFDSLHVRLAENGGAYRHLDRPKINVLAGLNTYGEARFYDSGALSGLERSFRDCKTATEMRRLNSSKY
jgi:hypothetical protein